MLHIMKPQRDKTQFQSFISKNCKIIKRENVDFLYRCWVVGVQWS